MVEIMWSDIIKPKSNDFSVRKHTNENLFKNFSTIDNNNPEQIMEAFYKEIIINNKQKIKRISLNTLQELKEKWITTEMFLDYLCQTHGILLHWSTNEIELNKLKSRKNKIFATNKASIAILKSIYSNKGVSLEYPYEIAKNKPFILKIHTPQNWSFISKEKWFIFCIKKDNSFKKNPNIPWEFIKESEDTEFSVIIETEKSDFKYPVEVIRDYNPKR